MTATRDRAEALEGADGVVITILAGGADVWRYDIEIPEKYGVDINAGATRGPAGIFRTLRTIPVVLGILADIERICPDALVLNYTNPMAMYCRAIQEQAKVGVTGLCYSAQGTAEVLARWIGAPISEITYRCAGINHQSWYLDCRLCGKDSYPLLREAVLTQPEICSEEQVRNEMFLHLDCHVTESSGPNSEYNAWFRTRPDPIERCCTSGTGWNPGAHAFILREYERREVECKREIESWPSQEQVDLEPGNEYAAWIFNAIFGDYTEFQFNCNVRNMELVGNLPDGCCVEVPASRSGLEPIPVGGLPAHLAILTGVNARIEELAVAASFDGDPRKVFHAICMDPPAPAVLSPSEIRQMTSELFERHRRCLPRFKHLSWAREISSDRAPASPDAARFDGRLICFSLNQTCFSAHWQNPPGLFR